MSEKLQLFVKKSVFLMDKYLFPKQKILYLVKGFSGMLIFWIYEFFSVFGGIANYEKMLVEGLNQVNSSEQMRSQLEDFGNSPIFKAAVVAFVIYSFMTGYLIMSFVHLIVDLLRRKVFKEFDRNKTL